ncbi:SRR1 [Aspergillus sclerotialis]|uniref:SRR1 n=1 Tax=Aspergillus sclerotialis TaxID=2070753 RepID=A0A3A2ZQ51_9EURO|nr:SRR1 [Aspergillus sclerotialis]
MHDRSAKKRPQQNQKQKRVEVTDSNGWTHVTTHGNARRTIRNTSSSCSSSSPSTPHRYSGSETSLSPAEAPRNLSLDDLRHQFQGYRARWEASESWRVIRDVLERRLTIEYGSGAGAGRIDNIICVGLGSPSGFLKGGWVDRRSVSMYQLAALVCIRDLFAKASPHTLWISAQDPVFNAHDKSLLSSLSITTIEHPHAFNIINQNTLLFCPGAERTHLELLLASNPSIVFGGPLEDTGSEVIGQFLKCRKESVRVPAFEGNEHAFWGVRVYFG